MSIGPSYTVMQIGRREASGWVTVLDSIPVDAQAEARAKSWLGISRMLREAIRVKLAEWGRRDLVTRDVTGHDSVVMGGLLDGVELPLRDFVPMHVDSQTDWVPWPPQGDDTD